MHDRFDACSQGSLCLQMALVSEYIPLSAQSQQERSDIPLRLLLFCHDSKSRSCSTFDLIGELCLEPKCNTTCIAWSFRRRPFSTRLGKPMPFSIQSSPVSTVGSTVVHWTVIIVAFSAVGHSYLSNFCWVAMIRRYHILPSSYNASSWSTHAYSYTAWRESAALWLKRIGMISSITPREYCIRFQCWLLIVIQHKGPSSMLFFMTRMINALLS